MTCTWKQTNLLKQHFVLSCTICNNSLYYFARLRFVTVCISTLPWSWDSREATHKTVEGWGLSAKLYVEKQTAWELMHWVMSSSTLYSWVTPEMRSSCSTHALHVSLTVVTWDFSYGTRELDSLILLLGSASKTSQHFIISLAQSLTKCGLFNALKKNFTV